MLVAEAAQFFALGLGEPVAISAHHGRWIDDLLDRVTESLAVAEPLETEDVACRLAIVGRPNVGKSSLVNALLRDERMIVSEVPGTTRDAVDTMLSFGGERVSLVDTAGIRRRGRVAPGIERASVRRAGAAVRRADVSAVVIDAHEGVTSQDLHVLGMAMDEGSGVVIVMNKSDLVDAEDGLRNSRERQLAGRARFASWAPIVWISALNGDAVDSVVAAGVACRRGAPDASVDARGSMPCCVRRRWIERRPRIEASASASTTPCKPARTRPRSPSSSTIPKACTSRTSAI